MCLIAFAIGASSRWPLLIASNRDEYFDRPAAALTRWQTPAGHEMISGRDLRDGGTWLGLNPQGRVAMLTNVRELPASGSQAALPQSRGGLLMRWLEGSMDAEQFMAQTDCMAYGGFNLVLGDIKTASWTWLSNRSFDRADPAMADRPVAKGWTSRYLPAGVYGLSNAALDTPWPKTVALRAALAEALKTPDEELLKSRLWTALADRTKASSKDLPDTGLPAALESVLSSAFIHETGRGQAGYGTRCSTLVLAGPRAENAAGWTIRVEEKTHGRPGLLQAPASGTMAASAAAVQWELNPAAALPARHADPGRQTG